VLLWFGLVGRSVVGGVRLSFTESADDGAQHFGHLRDTLNSVSVSTSLGQLRRELFYSCFGLDGASMYIARH
jgi:hypothetical protein